MGKRDVHVTPRPDGGWGVGRQGGQRQSKVACQRGRTAWSSPQRTRSVCALGHRRSGLSCLGTHDNERWSCTVQIHPFPNGNGRHSRELTDLILLAAGAAPFTWGSTRLSPSAARGGPTCGRFRRQITATTTN